jgi:hypothetical protein
MPDRNGIYQGVSIALVLECTSLARYSRQIGRPTGLPVFDVVRLVHWLHRSLTPEQFVQD